VKITMGQETVALTSAELKKGFVMQNILDGQMTNKEGAAVLGNLAADHSTKKNYREGDVQAHRNRGDESSSRLFGSHSREWLP
jgi:hypothetical protein